MEASNVQTDTVQSLRAALEAALSKISNSSPADSEIIDEALEILNKLSNVPISKKLLLDTGIGAFLGRFRKSASPQPITSRAAEIVSYWKKCIREAETSDATSSGALRHTTEDQAASFLAKGDDAFLNTRTAPVDAAASVIAENKPHTWEAPGALQKDRASSYSDVVWDSESQKDFSTGHAVSTGSTSPPAVALRNGMATANIPPPAATQSAPASDAAESDSILSYPGPLTKILLRDKVRTFLYRAFYEGVPKSEYASFTVANAARLICEIEEALYDHFVVQRNDRKGYSMQVKAVKWNLGDSSNPEFNERLYEGAIEPSAVPSMQSKDMASNAKKLERKRQFQEGLEACQSDWERRNLQVKDGQFTCHRCNGKKTSYQQIQIRSADEPMTTFVTCITCNNRWKF